jgi:plastocyanin
LKRTSVELVPMPCFFLSGNATGDDALRGVSRTNMPGEESDPVRTHDRSIRIHFGWRSAALAAALAGVLAAPAWTLAGPQQNGPNTATKTGDLARAQIEITKHKFSLPTVTIPAGATVMWVNRDEDVHTVVSTAQVFRSADLDTDEAYSYKFTKPGVYQYFCTLHPLMTGTVIVK